MMFWCVSGLEDYLWLAGTNSHHEGCWLWGAPYISKITEGNWNENQPNNIYNNQHCLTANKNFSWRFDDRPCTEENHYLCKRTVSTVTHVAPTLQQLWTTDLC